MLVEFVPRRKGTLASSTRLVYGPNEEAVSLIFWLKLLLGGFLVVVLKILKFFRFAGVTVAIRLIIVFVAVIDPSRPLLEVVSRLVTKVILVRSCGGTGVRFFALEGL